jgi:hypothetical protein
LLYTSYNEIIKPKPSEHQEYIQVCDVCHINTFEKPFIAKADVNHTAPGATKKLSRTRTIEFVFDIIIVG